MPTKTELKENYQIISGRVPEKLKRDFKIALLKNNHLQETVIADFCRQYIKNGLPGD